MSEKADFLNDVEEDGDDDDEVVEVEAEEVESDTGVTTPAPAAHDQNSLVRPVANVDEVAEVYEQFENIKSGLLKEGDTQTIGGGKNKQTFITKSGWRKIATAFNVSVDVVDKERSVDDGVLTWRVKARATAPNGKVAESWAGCASNESNHMEFIGNNIDEVDSHKVYDRDDPDVMKVEGKWRALKDPREVNEHDILATAETRAKNRAISDLVGGGSVSAEEITKESILE